MEKNKTRKKEEGISLDLPFLARYLPEISGEYLKVYMAYEFLKTSGEKVNEEMIADFLQTTEGQVKRALAFWEEEGILSNQKEEYSQIPENVAEEEFAQESVVPQIIVFAEIFLERELTMKEIAILNEIEKQCHYDFSLFQYLFDYCINEKKKNFSYMERVAMSWKERGIKSAEEARFETNHFSHLTSSVSKSMGIGQRMIASGEISFIESWIQKGISEELILEACRRTVLHTGKGSFPYADKILNDWISKGIRQLDDLIQMDESHNRSYEKKQEKQESKGKKAKNSFHNFNQRKDYDWDALEEALHNRY